MVAVRELLGREPVGGVYQPLRGEDLRARGVVRDDADAGAARARHRPPLARGAGGGARRGGRARRASWRRGCAAASCARRPRRARRAAARIPGSAGRRTVSAGDPVHRRAADARSRIRGGLAADGQRGQRQDVRDGRALRADRARRGAEDDVGRILAITFTEKAAAELKARVRGRFEALGDGERARATEGAWISTIHSFCARLLRAHALAAGLDPRFAVLDEREARRLAADAFQAAMEDLAGAHGDAALELIAAYRPGDLRDAIVALHGELRSRGHEHPQLPRALPADLQAAACALALARAQAAVELQAANDGKTVERARARLAACAALLERPLDPPPAPAEVDALALRGNGVALNGRRLRGVPNGARRLRGRLCRRGGGPYAHAARRAAAGVRTALRRREARRLRTRLRGPRAAREPLAARARAAARALRGALPPRDGRRVPGHEPAAARAAGAHRGRRAVRRRRRAAVDLRLPSRRRAPFPRTSRPPRRARRDRHARDELPQPPGSARTRSTSPSRRPSTRASRRWSPGARSRPARRRRPSRASSCSSSTARRSGRARGSSRRAPCRPRRCGGSRRRACSQRACAS